ncbi:MAG TPA: hypothetical protein VN420_02630 [Candidatus Fimivivens sp.]|nr:hypothetical protein [Candidatus Fimivivens sp.]
MDIDGDFTRGLQVQDGKSGIPVTADMKVYGKLTYLATLQPSRFIMMLETLVCLMGGMSELSSLSLSARRE